MNHLPSQVPHRIGPLIERLHALYPRLMDLSLDRLERLLAALGHPERRLPPVLHIAGTNGKGSTCAMLRALAEAAGLRAHVFTSPHLVRFNERFRLAGHLVTDDALAAAFEHVEQVNAGAPITVFEVIAAVAFHLFATTPADVCILEVGLGGRGDATNVVRHPAATAITAISLDHTELLGNTIAAIAARRPASSSLAVPSSPGRSPRSARCHPRRRRRPGAAPSWPATRPGPSPRTARACASPTPPASSRPPTPASPAPTRSTMPASPSPPSAPACPPSRSSPKALQPPTGPLDCSASTATSPIASRPAGNSGSMAATTRPVPRRSQLICSPGRLPRCTSWSA